VDTAVELLVLAEPENAEPLLWLLTFFYHPTNRGHQRSQQTVRDLIMALKSVNLTSQVKNSKVKQTGKLLMVSSSLFLISGSGQRSLDSSKDPVSHSSSPS